MKIMPFEKDAKTCSTVDDLSKGGLSYIISQQHGDYDKQYN